MKLISILRYFKNKCLGISLDSALHDKFFGEMVLKFYNRVNFGRKNFKVLPLIWWDNLPCNDHSLLRLGGKSIAFSPHFIGFPQLSEKVNLPNVSYYIFKNARVSAVSSSVIVNDEKIIVERAAVPDQKIHNYAGGHIWVHTETNAVIFVCNESRLKRGIFLGGNGSWNYYHWMMELLAKIEFIAQLPSHLQNFPLLVSEEIFSTPSLKKTLDIFTACCVKFPEIIALKKAISYVVDELIYINTPNSLPFNLIGNVKFKCTYSSVNSHSIEYLRNTALKYLLQDLKPKNYSSRIFLCRKTIRRNYNQDAVFTCLKKYGFTQVYMEDLSFSEQVKTIYYAEYIVGPTGAAWTNLIFSRAGTKALCWMAEELGDFSAFSNIARIVGVDLRYITYKADVRFIEEIYSKEYVIDLVKVELGLKELGVQVT